MNNTEFFNVIAESFLTCLRSGPRSNDKLKILHGAIAKDLYNELGDLYFIKSLGFSSGKESKIQGRYIDKVVDITVSNASRILAGLAVKFVMSNYSQNSNNYFEGMLGETANIRCGGKAYFQLLILPEVLPYFNKAGKITKWEHLNTNYLHKYVILSDDDSTLYMHTPIKTLIYFIKISGYDKGNFSNKTQYADYYLNKSSSVSISLSDSFPTVGQGVVINDYEEFRKKFVYYIKSI